MVSLTFKPRVPVIDANVCVGDHHHTPSPCRSRERLLDEMDALGVGRAVIYHAQTEEISPTDGNRQLEDWLDADGRLIPQWSVAATDASMAQIEALWREGRVRSARLHNAQSAGLPFRPWGYDRLLSWLGEVGIPLWIPLTEIDPHELISTLQGYPGIKSVLVGAHYTHALLTRPLLEALPGANLELSRYEPIGEIEALRDLFGARRLLYGSWYPRYAMGPMLFYIHHTDLSDEELRAVCSENTERLLELAPPA